MTTTLRTVRRFALTSWKMNVSFDQLPILNFNGIKVLNLSWTVPTTNNNTLELRIPSYPEFNLGARIDGNNLVYDYLYAVTLDPRQDYTLMNENLNPPFQLNKYIPKISTLDFEISINGIYGDVDISPTNPVYIEIAFFDIK